MTTMFYKFGFYNSSQKKKKPPKKERDQTRAIDVKHVPRRTDRQNKVFFRNMMHGQTRQFSLEIPLPKEGL